MRSAPASRCSNRGRWTAFPNVVGRVRKTAADRRVGRGEGLLTATVPTSPAEVRADRRVRASRRRASLASGKHLSVA